MSPFWCFPLYEPGVATVRHCAAQDGTRQHGSALQIRDAVLHRWGKALHLENIYSNEVLGAFIWHNAAE